MRRDRLLLALSALGAVNTINAYRPLSRTKYGGALSFAAGWTTSEEPLFTAATQAAGAAALVAGGAARTAAGKVALGGAVATWAALARLAERSEASSEVFEQALVDGLGAGYRTEIDARWRDEPRLTAAERFFPALGQRSTYRNVRKVSYGEFGRRNVLDVWRAADLPADANAPVLVHVHGGGWVIGNQEIQGEVLLSEMARRGWVGVSTTYRLSPQATWPDHIIDLKRALAWTKSNIAAHGGNPNFVALTGGSAGGHLCSFAALTGNDPRYQPGFEDADTAVDAAVPFYGVYDVGDLAGTGNRAIADVWERFVLKAPVSANRAVYEQASPITHVSPTAPPMMVLHGSNDTLVPVDQAQRFVAALRAVTRNPLVYAEVPHAQHAFEVYRSVRGLHAVRAVARFLQVIEARHRRAGANASQNPAATSSS